MFNPINGLAPRGGCRARNRRDPAGGTGQPPGISRRLGRHSARGKPGEHPFGGAAKGYGGQGCRPFSLPLLQRAASKSSAWRVAGRAWKAAWTRARLDRSAKRALPRRGSQPTNMPR